MTARSPRPAGTPGAGARRPVHPGHLDETARARTVAVDPRGDQLVVLAAHDPVVLAVDGEDGCAHLLPGLGEVAVLQLLVEGRRSAILVSRRIVVMSSEIPGGGTADFIVDVTGHFQ